MTIASNPRAIGRCFRLALLLAAVFCPGKLAAQEPTPPQDAFAGISVKAPDEFYDPPKDISGPPGTLLRSEPLSDVTLPEGMRGWRIKYVTTVDSATPATAVATVFAPVAPPKWAAPVVMWEHGTTGVMQKCMPSLSSAPALGIPALDRVVKAGWVIVATDYSFAEKDGPHPYLIGESEARAGLDSVRAARKMPELKLGSSTVVWGHSQGGQSALWTGIVGPRYAPDVRIAGVAAIAPATDMQKLLALNVALDKRLGSYLAVSYSRFYPDIRYEQAVNPRALWAAREIAKLCGFLPPEDPQRIGELAATFEGRVLAVGTNKALAVRMAQNVPNQPIAAPLLIAQGEDDAIVQPSVTDDYVSARCAAGQRLQYWKFTGADHGAIVQPGSKLDEKLIRWTTARFAGLPQAPGCPRRSF